MNNHDQPVCHHPEKDEAFLAMVASIVLELDREGIIERLSRLLEADAVPGKVRRCLDLIPFEFISTHRATVYP
jgi:hypothetical protein